MFDSPWFSYRSSDCANDRFCTKSRRTDLRGFLCCINVLHYRFDWRYIYAMLIGYARVSTDDQDTAAQVTALKAAGCERTYREKASGGRWDRPELHRLLDQMREGDVSIFLPMRSSAGTPGWLQNGAGSRPLSRFPVPLRPKALTELSVRLFPMPLRASVQNTRNFRRLGLTPCAAGFERRGVKAGPQATAESGAKRPLRLVAKPPLELV
jgi:hypothetical protein